LSLVTFFTFGFQYRVHFLQVEDAKKILILNGTKVSQVVKDVLSDVCRLKKAECVRFSRKNDVHPFEAGQEASLQHFARKSDCALFCMGNHSKKRPHNLILGRMFDFQLLDMIELGVKSHTSISEFRGASLLETATQVSTICISYILCSCGQYLSYFVLLDDVSDRRFRNLRPSASFQGTRRVQPICVFVAKSYTMERSVSG
jgi:hypothetical protein